MTAPVRFSSLKHIGRSPAHYRAALEASYDSPAMLFGRVVHAMVLGHGSWTVYEGERRGKAWSDFKADNEGVDIITAQEFRRARDCADAVLNDPVAAPFLVGDRERRIEWTHNGRACRGTPDVIGADFITDLKTTTDASPGLFSRAALRMGYHAQLAWYQHGVEAALDRTCPSGVLIAVESKAPYAVTVLRLTDRAIAAGHKTWVAWFERLVACEESGVWPGYSQSIVDLDVPDEDAFEGLLIDGEEIA